MIDFSSWQVKTILYIILPVLCYFSFFLHLNSFPMQLWDESRQAVNAFEMLQTKNFFVTYYNGQPDMWNTKSVFYVWFVALSMKLFGYNLIALRLPSALFGIATVFFIFHFCKNYLEEIRIGIFSALVLITSVVFLGTHVSRTADSDGLVTLLISIYSLSFFKFLESDDVKYFWTFIFCLALAVLTKSMVGLFMLPALFIYTLIKNKVRKVFINVRFVFGLLIFIGIVGGIYFLRAAQNPGYLKAVLNNEL
jgi:4-amino-4-deoxy-L-arabinose transferase-like glycosyltransferase